MQLHELISPDRILLIGDPLPNKQDLLQLLLRHTLKCDGQEADFDAVWAPLFERERSMSTGIGQGVAIPHCSTPAVPDVRGVLALLASGIDFEALDDEPVRIVVLMLMPKNKFDRHIQTLATVAKALNDPDFRKQVLAATTVEEAHETLKAAPGSNGGPAPQPPSQPPAS